MVVGESINKELGLSWEPRRARAPVMPPRLFGNDGPERFGGQDSSSVTRYSR